MVPQEQHRYTSFSVDVLSPTALVLISAVMMNRRWGIDRGTAVAGVLNVLAYTASGLAGQYHLNWIFWLSVGIGSLATLTLIFLTARSTTTSKRLVDQAAAAQRGLLQQMLVPLVEVLGAIAVAPNAQKRRELQGQMKHAVVVAARHIGSGDARACLLELSGLPGMRNMSCSPGMWFGRQEVPQTTFKEGTPRGDRLLKSMDSRKPLFVENLETEPAEYQPDSTSYKTFIAAAVAPVSTHQSFGVLTIDSVKAGDLKETDKKIIEVLGQLLGSALAM